MEPVGRRLLVAVPFAALAFIVSILWVRRSRSCKEPTEKEAEKQQKAELVATGYRPDKAESLQQEQQRSIVKEVSAEEKVLDQKTKDLLVEQQLPDQKEDWSVDQRSLEQNNELSLQQSIDLKKEDQSSEQRIIDKKEENKPFVDNTTVLKREDLQIEQQPIIQKEQEEEQLIQKRTVKHCLLPIEEEPLTAESVERLEHLPSPQLVERKEIALIEATQATIKAEKEPEKIESCIPSSSSSEKTQGETMSTEVEKNHLADKLANLEVDTIKMRESEESGGRDSANHSPSEGMLASPSSISNYSDLHSEGSCDSGKGHSDVAISPARTPIDGTSVAGDSMPSIYEFIIPQVITGRLIGRNGSSLHEIMSTSHTNILIKRHPESNKLKICAIEGNQQDIDKALDLIRQKFPIRKYPKVTLERVSFANLYQQLSPEDFHLQLIEGVNNDVVVSSLISAGHMFIHQPSHPTYPCLTNLTVTMTHVYSALQTPPLAQPVKDAVCVAPSMGGWYRVQIMRVSEDGASCDIKFVDYGGYLTIETAALKQIRGDFLMLQFQAVECALANVVPIHGEGWSEEARLFVHNMTFKRILQAQVVCYTDQGVPLINLFTSFGPEVVMVNEMLVNEGFACWVVSEEAPLPQEV